MAGQLPAALKSADIQRFATRAAQLEKYKPIATYWLEYSILQQILVKSLHTSSPEAQAYAVHLMDKLEQTKESYSAEAAVTDDVAAKAYMEQFALETFNRADEAQRANKATRQTADTFQAAATFFDSLSTWGDIDTDSKAKSKFAKYHALRIARAIKDGADPNETNPQVDLPATGSEEGLEAELKELESSTQAPYAVYRPPTVEPAPDSAVPSRPGSAVPSGAANPSRAGPKTDKEHDVSPIEPPETVASRSGSVGGGYFPAVPLGVGDQPTADAEEMAAPHIDNETHIPRLATAADMAGSSINDETHIPPQSTSNIQAPTSQVGSAFGEVDRGGPPIYSAKDITPQPASDPSNFYSHAPPAVSKPPVAPIASPDRPHGPPPTASKSIMEPVQIGTQPSVHNYRYDDDSLLAAQKHARWAISALNFEDVPTAVKELRAALQTLGGI